MRHAPARWQSAGKGAGSRRRATSVRECSHLKHEISTNVTACMLSILCVGGKFACKLQKEKWGRCFCVIAVRWGRAAGGGRVPSVSLASRIWFVVSFTESPAHGQGRSCSSCLFGNCWHARGESRH